MQKKYIKKNKTEILNKETKKQFRLSSKRLFLTYSPCDLSLELILKQFEILTGTWGIKEYVIVREQGEKGDFHIHAYIELNRRCDIRRSNYLDVITGENNIYHGNYLGIKAGNADNTIEYILKNVISKFDRENLIYSEKYEGFITENCRLLSIDAWLIEQSEKGNITDTLERLKDLDPERYFKHSILIEKTMRTLYMKKTGFQIKFDMNKFYLPKNVKEQVYDKDIVLGRNTMYMMGDPGSGKSQFIKTFISHLRTIALQLFNVNLKGLSLGGKPLIINNYDGLRFFNPSVHDSIVIDDMNWAEIHDRETLIKMLDSEDSSTFNIKHSTILIPENTQRFIVSNKSLEDYLKERTDIIICDAIKRRYKTVFLEAGVKLFAPNLEEPNSLQ